jgi:hypothetical protein
VIHLNWGDWSGNVVALVESLVDGAGGAAAVEAVAAAVVDFYEAAGGIITPAENAVLALPRANAGPRFSVWDAGRVAIEAARAAGFDKAPYPTRADNPDANRRARKAAARRRGRARVKEAAVQAGLLRDVFGNPFRAAAVSSDWLAWNDGAVQKIAEGIYEGRAFERLPILHDALLDAGCDDEGILTHCRTPDGHVCGCWAVDLLLGKE